MGKLIEFPGGSEEGKDDAYYERLKERMAELNEEEQQILLKRMKEARHNHPAIAKPVQADAVDLDEHLSADEQSIERPLDESFIEEMINGSISNDERDNPPPLA